MCFFRQSMDESQTSKICNFSHALGAHTPQTHQVRNSPSSNASTCSLTVRCSMLQYVAICCSMLQYVVVCCSVTKCVAVCCSTHLRLPIRGNEALCLSDIVLQCVAVSCCSTLQYRVAVCCSIVLQYVAVSCCSTLQYLVLYCSMLQHVAHVAVCCSVLQCVAVCCSVLQCVAVCGSTHLLLLLLLQGIEALFLFDFAIFDLQNHRSPIASRHIFFTRVLACQRDTETHTKQRERERKREIRIYVYIHIYIYILFSTCRITARQSRALCCSVLLCVAVCCSALQCVVVCRSVLQCVAVCCSNGGEPVDPTTIELTASLRCRVVQCVAA